MLSFVPYETLLYTFKRNETTQDKRKTHETGFQHIDKQQQKQGKQQENK